MPARNGQLFILGNEESDIFQSDVWWGSSLVSSQRDQRVNKSATQAENKKKELRNHRYGSTRSTPTFTDAGLPDRQLLSGGCIGDVVLNSVSVPIFLLFCQLSIAVILLKLSHLVGLIKLPSKMFRNLFNSTNSFKLLKDILPMVLINVSGLIFNTYCLKFVDASFYQVARGLIYHSQYSHHTSNPRNFIINNDINTCDNSQENIRKVPSTIALTYYSNGLSALIVFPLIFILGETQTILQLFSNGFDGFKTFFIGTIVTGLFGFFICIAGLLSIKVTSPVTHMISSAVRGVIQVDDTRITISKTKITSGRVLGIGIILIGSIYYTWIKDQEVHQNNKIQDSTFNLTKNIRLNEMNNDNSVGRAEEMDSLILDIDNDDQDDDDDGDQDQKNQTYVDQLSPIITTTPQKNSDHNEADDNNDDDETMRMKRMKMKICGN
ncbi:hypothetical protein KEM48_010882 [Puccinia striiformis f. sp. tritici PST-130]|nr:hypothetical protein KEM48_010882 [Puccinia striiformis f. sp. tritici PST-130]